MSDPLADSAAPPFVLVIDDDAVERELLEGILVRAGYLVRTAPDGQAGLDAVAERRPDLVLLDVLMPKLNGYQTCRALKRAPATATCPVVMLTAKNEPTDHRWAGEVGADAFLTKPADVPALLSTIVRLTGRPVPRPSGAER